MRIVINYMSLRIWKEDVLFVLHQYLPAAYRCIRTLWWQFRRRAPAPKPGLGNCQSYLEYRENIQEQIDTLILRSAHFSNFTILEYDGLGEYELDVSDGAGEIIVCVRAAADLVPGGARALASTLHAHNSADFAYCDHEIQNGQRDELVALTAPDIVGWAQGAPYPQCIAFRKMDLAINEEQWADFKRDWLKGLVELVKKQGVSAGVHLPLPLCKVTGDRIEELKNQKAFINSSESLSAFDNRRVSISIIVPTRNGGSLLESCINSILPAVRELKGDGEILIVDNGSDDTRTLSFLRTISAHPQVRVETYDHPFNYSEINNWAVNLSNSDYVLFLNDDVEAHDEHWLSYMLATLDCDETGVVGAQLCYPSGRLQHAGVALGLGGVAEHPGKGLSLDNLTMQRWCGLGARSVSAVTAACMLTTRELFSQLGGFNEQELKIAFNDVDFCLRAIGAGYRVAYQPGACLTHHESASRGLDQTWPQHRRFSSEVAYMKDTWAAYIANDPYYSPHFSRHASDLSFRRPASQNLGEGRVYRTPVDNRYA